MEQLWMKKVLIIREYTEKGQLSRTRNSKIFNIIYILNTSDLRFEQAVDDTMNTYVVNKIQHKVNISYNENMFSLSRFQVMQTNFSDLTTATTNYSV